MGEFFILGDVNIWTFVGGGRTSMEGGGLKWTGNSSLEISNWIAASTAFRGMA